MGNKCLKCEQKEVLKQELDQGIKRRYIIQTKSKDGNDDWINFFESDEREFVLGVFARHTTSKDFKNIKFRLLAE